MTQPVSIPHSFPKVIKRREALLKAIAKNLVEHVRAKTVPLLARIETLEKRVAELEARPEIVDRGVWREGGTYARGSACSLNGSLWIAQNDTTSRPGTNAEWRLAVKSGEPRRPTRRNG